MATWKKVIVSGSNAHLAQITSSVLTSNNLVSAGTGGALQNSGLTLSGNVLNIGANSITSTGANSVLTGSFSGSFQGTLVTNLPDLTQGAGITAFTYDGSGAATVAVSGASALNTNAVTRWSGAAFVNSSLTDTGTVVSGASSVQLTGANSALTGSFTGSFTGITNLPDLTAGAGISTFTYDGGATANVAVSGASALVSNRLTRWSGTAFITSSLSDTGTVVSGASSLQLTGTDSALTGSFTGSFRGANSALTGSFTGSFAGDGSGLTGLASTLRITGSAGTGTVNLLTQGLSILGTTNEIETAVSSQTVTIGLPNSVTITEDLTVSRNLVVLGTASFQNTSNLDVADRFIRLASGSNSAGDGGIAVQQSGSLNSEVFGFDSGLTRWGVTSSFDATQNAFTPNAFMALSLIGTGTDPTAVAARYQVNGNIFIGTDEGIWIYS
jgi:hypothetical protein